MINLLVILFILIMGSNRACSNSCSDQKQIPVSPKTEIANWNILIDGKSIDSDIDLVSILVIHELNQPSYAEVTIQFKDKLPPVGKAYTEVINKKIEIIIGYDFNLQTIFKGIIISQRISQSLDDPYLFIVQCENNQKPVSSSTTSSPMYTLQYGTNVLDFELSINSDKKIEGFVSTFGLYEPLIGNIIQLDGFMAGFNKLVRIYLVEHHLDSSGWTTTLNISQDN